MFGKRALEEGQHPEQPASSLTDIDTVGPDTNSFTSSIDEEIADVRALRAEVCHTVLQTAPGAPRQSPASYTNVTPWVTRVFFVHTYYAYIYVFYMFVLAFYKGYALEYPDWRRWMEMVFIMFIPALQHLRFYFGYWGCELGMAQDLCFFIVLCSLVMLVLMYFLFMQAYIVPLDGTLLFVAVVAVGVEGVCGAINALQTLKAQSSSLGQLVAMSASILLLFASLALFAFRELLPHEAVVEEVRWSQTS